MIDRKTKEIEYELNNLQFNYTEQIRDTQLSYIVLIIYVRIPATLITWLKHPNPKVEIEQMLGLLKSFRFSKWNHVESNEAEHQN
jgi:hypothetical protein